MRGSTNFWNKRISTFDVINHCIMVVVIIITLYPFWSSMVGSFNNGLDLAKGGVHFWPRKFTLENYRVVFSDGEIIDAYKITVMRTLIGTAFSLLVTTLFSYAFSRKDLLGKGVYGSIGVFTMFFSGGLIPTYMIIKSLGLINNFWVYIFPPAFNFFNVLVMTAGFREIPYSVIESAKIDGAGEYRIFFKLAAPLAKPSIAVITLFVGVFHWNQFFDALMYINKTELQTIQLYLMKVIRTQQQASIMAINSMSEIPDLESTGRSIQLATMMVATVPILILYPFLQRYFVKGVMVGSIKG